MRNARVEALLPRFAASEFIDEETRFLLQMQNYYKQQADATQKRKGFQKGRSRTLNLGDLKATVEAKDSLTPTGHKRISGAVVEKSNPNSVSVTSSMNSSSSSTSAASTPLPATPGAKDDPRRKSPKAVPSILEETEERRPSKDALVDLSDLPAFVRDYKGNEPLPLCVRKKVLYEHVVDMQLSFWSRLKEWEEHRKSHQLEEDLANMGMLQESDLAAVDSQRRPLAIEFERLEGLYATTYEAFVRGDFRSLIYNERRHLKKSFGFWRGNIRLAHRSKVVNAKEKESTTAERITSTFLTDGTADKRMSNPQSRVHRETSKAHRVNKTNSGHVSFIDRSITGPQ